MPPTFRAISAIAACIVMLLASATAARAQTVHVTDDTNINLNSPNQLNGTATTLFVRNSGAGGERHGFLQFDLSSLPAAGSVARATLRLFVTAVNDPGTINVHAVLNPWDEATLAAANAPPLGTLIASVNLSVADQGKFVLVDVTTLAQAWADGSLPNSGLALVPQTANPVRVTLDSKESTTTSHAPELEVSVLPVVTADITGVAAGAGLSGGGTSGDVTLSLDTGFTDARYASLAHAHNVSEVAGAATLGANAFNGTQTIDAGHLDLDPSTASSGAVTKNGVPFLHNAGANNTFLGLNAGSLSASGFGGNTAVGAQALMSQTFGGPNTAVGFAALAANTGGTGNTALGHGALTSNTTGFENTAAGGRALDSTTDGFMNTAFGSQALRFNTTGAHNTALGRGALTNNLGGFNTAVGSSSVSANTSGQGNTAVGQGTLFSNTTGSDNVAVGLNAGINATTGSNNVYLGANVVGIAGESNTMYLGGTQTTTIVAGVRGTTVSGGEVVMIDAAGRLGSSAVTPAANSVGSAEVIDEALTAADLGASSVGTSELATDSVTAAKVAFPYAGSATESGAAIDLACIGCVDATEVSFSFAGTGANTFTGTQTVDAGNIDLDASTAAGGNLTKNGVRFLHNAGSDSVFIGLDAGNFTTIGSGNAAVGARALRDNTSGANNTAVGMNALFHNTSGQGNTAHGTNALANSTTGQGNTALGSFAMLANTTGGVNTAIGSSTLMANTTGNRNVATGSAAMQSNTGGTDNTAAGHAALNRNTNGSRNTVTGYQALFNNLTGGSNTVAGADAMLNATGGSNNVAVGSNAGLNATTGSNNIYIGANVQGVAGESNTMYLGSTQTTTIIAGVRGTAVTGGEVVVIDAAGRLGSGTVAPAANSVGSSEVIDDSLTAADLAPNAVGASELTADSVSADKVAFNYAASVTEGGAAIDVACVACVGASEVGFSFAGLGANTFTGTQTIDTGNLDLDPSTATVGNITKNGVPFLHNVGANNTFLGLNAGSLSASGFGANTAVGAQALMSQTFGGPNTAVGFAALAGNTGGTGNTALGHGALTSNTVGFENTAAGARALDTTTDGFMNTAVGSQALRFNTTGDHNTAVGRGALTNNVGGFNTAVGSSAVAANTTGQGNTALGQSTLFGNTTGSDNVAVGLNAGINATTGSNNVYLGANVVGVASESNTMYLGGTQTKTVIAGVRGTAVSGGEVVLIDAAGRLGSGSVTPPANSIGSAEVIDDSLTAADLAASAVTSSELAADSVTADKVAFNYAAGAAEGGAALDVACAGCVAASEVGFTFAGLGSNTFSGTQTISSGHLDLASGNLIKSGGTFLHTSGTNNTFVGLSAGNIGTTGFGKNSAFGRSALGSLGTGDSNTATGYLALASNTDGNVNTATGVQALFSNTTGGGNVATGNNAMNFNTTGTHNAAMGYFALAFNTTGGQNVALGGSALESSTTGSGNTAVGYAAMRNGTSTNTIGIGRQAGRESTGTNNIYIGSDLVGLAGESNVMYLGRLQTRTVIAGIRGITTVNPDAIPVMIDSAGQLGTVSSSRRFKTDINAMADASERIFNLRPVTFRYTHSFGNGSKPLQFGLVAEEVAEVFPELAVRGANGAVETVHYETLNVLLLNELQKMRGAMQSQQQRIETLERQLAEVLSRTERERR